MFNNIIRHSLRSFKRQRAYIIINILGLSIGIACSLLIALFVINEASYDKFNVKKDRIYRVILNGKIGGREITYATSPAIMGPTLVKEFPEIEDFLRMTGGGPTVVEYNNIPFTEEHLVEADSSFFNFFSIPVLRGDPKNLLNAKHRVVLSESTAKKIFGKENPIDKQLKIGSDTTRYIVTGVMGDIPITPVTMYRVVSDPILSCLSIGFSFPNIFFAVDSERTTRCLAFRRFLGSPLRTGIEKKLKNEESASTRCSSVKGILLYSTTVGPPPVILRKSSISGNSFTNVGPIIAGEVA